MRKYPQKLPKTTGKKPRSLKIKSPGGESTALEPTGLQAKVSERQPKAHFKLDAFIELMELVENAFTYKLKARYPSITEEEISQELVRWYLDRTEDPMIGGDIVTGDLSRFYGSE